MRTKLSHRMISKEYSTKEKVYINALKMLFILKRTEVFLIHPMLCLLNISRTGMNTKTILTVTVKNIRDFADSENK